MVCPLTAILPNAFAPSWLFVIVIVSVPGVVVIAIPVPAASVNVSAVLSATTLVCPDTAIVLNALSPASPQLKFPEPSVLRAYPAVPSPSGNTQIWSPLKAGASNPT